MRIDQHRSVILKHFTVIRSNGHKKKPISLFTFQAEERFMYMYL